jgi:hypothetical protein
MSIIERVGLLALVALAACSSPARPRNDADLRTKVYLAYDAQLEPVARDLEPRYELDRPDVDLVPVARAEGARADVLLLTEPAPGQGLARVQIERVVGVFVPAQSTLRLIDLSKGTCDVVIGRTGTALGDLCRRTLVERGLGDEVNPRLLEADTDDIFDWIIERDAVGLAFVALAEERSADVRLVARGASETAAIVATTGSGRSFIDWLRSGVTTRRPLRRNGFDLSVDPMAPKDSP